MKHFSIAAIVAIMAVVCIAFAADEAPTETPTAKEQAIKFDNFDQKISYCIGLSVGQSLKRDGLKIDTEFLAKGINDILKGNQLPLSEEEIAAAFEELQKNMAAQQAKAGDANLAAGKSFLEANGKKEGIKTTASGLQYEVLQEGKGNTPTAADTVKTHYRGTLVDGTEFDSSYRRGEPATFPVSGVIRGWTEALQLMKEGSKYRLYIPSDLAYGPRGAGDKIGPNAVLIFDIELLSIVKGE